jgi:FtsZ-interacting cell division protein YlmF
MADDWSGVRGKTKKPQTNDVGTKPALPNKVNSNKPELPNSNVSSKPAFKPSKNKKTSFSTLINDGVCSNCLYGSCKNHNNIDERIPENLVRYVKNPTSIKNFGDEIIKSNFGIDGMPRFTTCKFMLKSCNNCNNGRCITINYQSKDILLCFSEPNKEKTFFVGAHIDVHYEEKAKGFDITVLPFDKSSIKIQVEDDNISVSSQNSRGKNTDNISVSSQNSRGKNTDNISVSSQNSRENNTINEDFSYAKITNTEVVNESSSNNKELDDKLIEMTSKYSDMVSRYNKLNEDLKSSKDLIKSNKELNINLNEITDENHILRNENNKLINDISKLKKEIESLKNDKKLLALNLEKTKVNIELDNIVAKQVINTHFERYQLID